MCHCLLAAALSQVGVRMPQDMVRWALLVFTTHFILLASVMGSDNKPLVLTNLLKEGKCEEAQKLALVSPDFGEARSYTGFFNVNEECGNHLFFWFFPAEIYWEDSPVLLWINEGSRVSVLEDMFMDVGPFNYNRSTGFTKREYPWNRKTNLLFIDQPVGNGFSFTEKGCYPKDIETISKEVYAAIVQFFKLFPILQSNKFFIVGENFAGYYAPSIAREIDTCNGNAEVKVNLVGIVVGDPYLDLRCHSAAEYEYQLGIIDERTRNIELKFEKNITSHINAKNYTGTADIVDDFPFDDDGLPTYFNILKDEIYPSDFETYIRNFKVREQIHVGNAKYNWFSQELYKPLRGVLYQPINSYLEDILKEGKYIVGFYGGQLDVYNPYTAITCVLGQLKWPAAKEYQIANRTLWYEGDRLAGWVKVAGTVWEAAVRDSGLHGTQDQPCAIYNLVMAAIADTPGKKLLTNLNTKLPGATD